jgi:hypothetical protein
MPAVVLPFVIGNQPAQPPTQASDFDANFNALAAAIAAIPTNTGIPWVVAGGAADAITAAYSPAVVALTDGLTLQFRATAANATATPTFTPNGLTPHNITKNGGSALVPGDIPAALAECIVVYNLANTRWELANVSISPFVSAQQTITAGGALTLAHGLGAIPNHVEAWLINVTGEFGYVTGNRTHVATFASDAATNIGISIIVDATNLTIRFGSDSTTFNVSNATTGASDSITNANWKIYFVAAVL